MLHTYSHVWEFIHTYQKQEVNIQQNHGSCLYVASDVTVVGVCNGDVYSSSYYFSTIHYHLANGSNSSFSEQHLNNNQELCKRPTYRPPWKYHKYHNSSVDLECTMSLIVKMIDRPFFSCSNEHDKHIMYTFLMQTLLIVILIL